jgi:hypothetical protein
MADENSPEWYTPGWIIYPIREVLDCVIDLDPCMPSDPIQVQKILRRTEALSHYTKDDNGLIKPWYGNVFCNPPYDRKNLPAFSQKMVQEFKAGNIKQGILLVPARPGSKWFQELMKEWVVCFLQGRLRFENPQNIRGSGMVDNALFYIGPDDGIRKFLDVFSPLGTCMTSL